MPLEWNCDPVKGAIAKFISEPDYSLDVYAGRERVDGTKQPARRWIDAAVQEFPIEKDFRVSYIATGDINEAFEFVAEDLHDQIKAQIKSPHWQWDRPTRRSDGTVVTSPRDIYDQGELYEGQKLSIETED